MTTTEERKTLVVSYVIGEYHLSCPCGWSNHIYTNKAQATDWAHAHDRTHARPQDSTQEE